MSVEIRETDFDPWDRLRRFQSESRSRGGHYGATAIFIGTMRDLNEGRSVQEMFLEHYPEMTARYLERICEEARARWQILDILVIHRVGTLRPNDPIVLAAVWSAHRAEAFSACRYLIEELKSRVPFWKKEQSGDSAHWVERNSPG